MRVFMRFLHTACLISTCALLVFVVGVQSSSSQPLPPAGEDQPSRRRAIQMIQTMRIWRMTEALDLNEEQVSQFFPRLKDLDKTREQHERERHAILRDLEYLLESGKAKERDLREKVDALTRVERKFHEERERLRGEMFSLLTVEQQARFLVFQEQFERELRDIIREARRGGHPPRPSGQ